MGIIVTVNEERNTLRWGQNGPKASSSPEGFVNPNRSPFVKGDSLLPWRLPDRQRVSVTDQLGGHPGRQHPPSLRGEHGR